MYIQNLDDIDRLVEWVVKRGIDETTAQDIVANALCNMYARLREGLSLGPEKFHAYLMRCVKNQCKDHWRRKRPPQVPFTDQIPESPPWNPDLLDDCTHFITSILPASERPIFKVWCQRQLSGPWNLKSYSEKAKCLGVAEKTLRNQLSVMGRKVRAIAERRRRGEKALEDYRLRARDLHNTSRILSQRIETVDLSGLATGFDCWRNQSSLILLQDELERVVKDRRISLVRNFVYDDTRLSEIMIENFLWVLEDHKRRRLEVAVIEKKMLLGHSNGRALLADQGTLAGLSAFGYGHFYPIGPDSATPEYQFAEPGLDGKFNVIARNVESVSKLATPLESARDIAAFITSLRRQFRWRDLSKEIL